MKHIVKWVSRLQAQVKSQISDPMDPVSITWLLNAFNVVCIINSTHEGAAMWLFPSFMSKSTAPELTARLSLNAK